MTTRYADQRLAALWDRVEQLEAAVQIAGAYLEYDKEAAMLESGGRAALLALKAAQLETFRGVLLCSRSTSDESLDTWLKEIESHEAATVETSEAQL